MDRLLLSLRSLEQSSKDVLDLVLPNAFENDDLSYKRKNNVIENRYGKQGRVIYTSNIYIFLIYMSNILPMLLS